jgi:hypothetical protein
MGPHIWKRNRKHYAMTKVIKKIKKKKMHTHTHTPTISALHVKFFLLSLLLLKYQRIKL